MRTESSLNHREESHPRKKHKHPKVGFKTTESKAYLNQEEILGRKGVIYTTPASNGKYQFRTWIAWEEKYFRKSLRTTDRELALSRGEDEMLGILAQQRVGHKIFGLSPAP